MSEIKHHFGWSAAFLRRWSELLGDMGADELRSQYPKLVDVIESGPSHRLAPDVIGQVAEMNKSADLWKPLLVRKMVTRAVELYSYFGEGARDTRNTAARRIWFRLLDRGNKAEEDRDMKSVRTVVAEILGKLPKQYREIGDPVPQCTEAA